MITVEKAQKQRDKNVENNENGKTKNLTKFLTKKNVIIGTIILIVSYVAYRKFGKSNVETNTDTE